MLKAVLWLESKWVGLGGSFLVGQSVLVVARKGALDAPDGN